MSGHTDFFMPVNCYETWKKYVGNLEFNYDIFPVRRLSFVKLRCMRGLRLLCRLVKWCDVLSNVIL